MTTENEKGKDPAMNGRQDRALVHTCTASHMHALRTRTDEQQQWARLRQGTRAFAARHKMSNDPIKDATCAVQPTEEWNPVAFDLEFEGESLSVEQLPVDGAGAGQHSVHERVGAAGEHLDLIVPALLRELGLLGQEGLSRDAAALHVEGDAAAVAAADPAGQLGGLEVRLGLFSAGA